VASLKEQLEERSCKILDLSADRVKRKVAKAYGMLPPDANVYGEMGLILDLETPAVPSDTEAASVRSVFVIGPDKRIRAMLTYPMTTGRDLDEVLRVLDSCQRAAKAREPSLRFILQPR
jgi:alkyl hydroperoxide reductase subunit AhpC